MTGLQARDLPGTHRPIPEAPRQGPSAGASWPCLGLRPLTPFACDLPSTGKAGNGRCRYFASGCRWCRTMRRAGAWTRLWFQTCPFTLCRCRKHSPHPQVLWTLVIRRLQRAHGTRQKKAIAPAGTAHPVRQDASYASARRLGYASGTICEELTPTPAPVKTCA